MNGNMDNSDGRYWGSHGKTSVSSVYFIGIGGKNSLLDSKRRSWYTVMKQDICTD